MRLLVHPCATSLSFVTALSVLVGCAEPEESEPGTTPSDSSSNSTNAPTNPTGPSTSTAPTTDPTGTAPTNPDPTGTVPTSTVPTVPTSTVPSGGGGAGGTGNGPSGGAGGDGNTGGTGGTGGGPGAGYDFAGVVSFLATNCLTCHVGPGGDSHDPDYRDDGELYTRLTTYTVAKCGGKPLVDPGNPDNSALIAVLEGGQCGDLPRMPYGDSEFSEVPNEIPGLRQWILDGAL